MHGISRGERGEEEDFTTNRFLVELTDETMAHCPKARMPAAILNYETV
jgi:hypothetical protein